MIKNIVFPLCSSTRGMSPETSQCCFQITEQLYGALPRATGLIFGMWNIPGILRNAGFINVKSYFTLNCRIQFVSLVETRIGHINFINQSMIIKQSSMIPQTCLSSLLICLCPLVFNCLLHKSWWT